MSRVFGNDMEEITEKQNDEAHASDMEGLEDGQHSRVLEDDELGHSSRVLSEEEESRIHASEEEEDPGSTSEQEADPTPVMSPEDAIKAAHGRLQEINRLRSSRRDADAAHIQEMSGLRKEVLELQEWKAQREYEAEVPEEVRNDPTYRGIDDRLSQLEESQSPQEPDPRQDLARRQLQDVVETSNRSVSEFTKARPDFQEARAAVRGYLANHYGTQDENVLRGLEIRMADNWMRAGQDPAAAMYESALQVGYKPGDGEVAESNPVKPRSVTRRIQSQVDSPQIPTSETASPRGAMTRAQFFSQFSDAEQTRVLQNEEAFEQLSTTGRIDSRYLPGGR